MTDSTWNELETSLRQLYSLTHNRAWIRKSGSSVEAEVNNKVRQIKAGIAVAPTREEYLGPRLFLRVVGPTSRAYYSGAWWFDASILESLERSYSRIFFNERELKDTLRVMLREVLAVSNEWNPIEEVWALELPAGERLTGFSGAGAPQKLFGSIPLTAKGNRMLVGRVRQIFFPVKNPLWVKHFRNLV